MGNILICFISESDCLVDVKTHMYNGAHILIISRDDEEIEINNLKNIYERPDVIFIVHYIIGRVTTTCFTQNKIEKKGIYIDIQQ